MTRSVATGIRQAERARIKRHHVTAGFEVDEAQQSESETDDLTIGCQYQILFCSQMQFVIIHPNFRPMLLMLEQLEGQHGPLICSCYKAPLWYWLMSFIVKITESSKESEDQLTSHELVPWSEKTRLTSKRMVTRILHSNWPRNARGVRTYSVVQQYRGIPGSSGRSQGDSTLLTCGWLSDGSSSRTLVFTTFAC